MFFFLSFDAYTASQNNDKFVEQLNEERKEKL